jgi:hypothetical protein
MTPNSTDALLGSASVNTYIGYAGLKRLHWSKQ